MRIIESPGHPSNLLTDNNPIPGKDFACRSVEQFYNPSLHEGPRLENPSGVYCSDRAWSNDFPWRILLAEEIIIMKKLFRIGIITLLTVFFFSWFVVSDLRAQGYEQSFRCRGDIVNKGDSKYRVLAKCGPPSASEVTGSSYLSGFPVGEVGIVEELIYNLGPTDFVYTLRFVSGNLYEIYRGGRGFSVIK
jgi:hypothetical protein